MFLDEYFSFDLSNSFFFSLKEYLPSIYLVLREIHFFLVNGRVRERKIIRNAKSCIKYFQIIRGIRFFTSLFDEIFESSKAFEKLQ